jgi:hypothetical protein
MIDLGYPVVAVDLAIDDASGREPQATGGAAPRSSGVIAHRVVTEALASQDYVVAERAARVACELLPGDETAVLDLARVLDARGQVERARAVLASFANSDRPAPVTDERE